MVWDLTSVLVRIVNFSMVLLVMPTRFLRELRLLEFLDLKSVACLMAAESTIVPVRASLL